MDDAMAWVIKLCKFKGMHDAGETTSLSPETEEVSEKETSLIGYVKKRMIIRCKALLKTFDVFICGTSDASHVHGSVTKGEQEDRNTSFDFCCSR